MKKIFVPLIIIIALLLFGLTYSCKKDSSITPPPTDIGTAISFTEEFEDMSILPSKGWVLKDNSPVSSTSGPNAAWGQGRMTYDKGGAWSGFTAYSYSLQKSEFAYSVVYANSSNPYSISSWLITPVLSVKNGDKISFYSRGDTTATFTDRLQVLMNFSANDGAGSVVNSVGNFTTKLIEINEAQIPGVYPIVWTKYEYTFTGITGKTDTRIAFRHYVTNITNSKGIGIDQFKFQVN